MNESASAGNVVASAFANSALMSLSALASMSAALADADDADDGADDDDRGVVGGRPLLLAPHADGGVTNTETTGSRSSCALT